MSAMSQVTSFTTETKSDFLVAKLEALDVKDFLHKKIFTSVYAEQKL